MNDPVGIPSRAYVSAPTRQPHRYPARQRTSQSTRPPFLLSLSSGSLPFSLLPPLSIRRQTLSRNYNRRETDHIAMPIERLDPTQ
jgi:hypothetical protein